MCGNKNLPTLGPPPHIGPPNIFSVKILLTLAPPLFRVNFFATLGAQSGPIIWYVKTLEESARVW